jgi:hypothetical protein
VATRVSHWAAVGRLVDQSVWSNEHIITKLLLSSPCISSSSSLPLVFLHLLPVRFKC